jgi:GNAT superfamily N-acetyltransferase
MMFVDRLAAEFRTRGPVGFTRFAMSRLCQWRFDVLYEAYLPELIQQQTVQPLSSFVQVGKHNFGSAETAAVERAVLTDVNYAYRDTLRGDDLLFAATDSDGDVLAYGFVLFDSYSKKVLGEATETPLIGNCYTLPEHRRKGLYARLLMTICTQLANAGHRRAIITCAPDNVASVRGIENAGFTRVQTVKSLLVASRWIAFQSLSRERFEHRR